MACSVVQTIAFCLWVLSLFSSTEGSTSNIMSVKDYFTEIDSDLTKITWAHAVNSRAKLEEALNGPLMMLEADIIMATVEGSDKPIPIMAHPPNTTSDLTFKEFLTTVLDAVNTKSFKKGIKLDFKDDKAVTPVLATLRKKMKKLTFPVWINADILEGPLNSTQKPLNATDIIIQTKNIPHAALSLGWTTRFGFDDSKDSNVHKNAKAITDAKYSNEDVKKMIKLLVDNKIETGSMEISFPLRAGIAVQSIPEILTLISEAGLKSTITIWSAPNDPINMGDLQKLINSIGKHRCYLDLPFSPEIGPETTTTSPDVDQDTVHDHHENVTTNSEDKTTTTTDTVINGAGLTSTSLMSMSYSLLIIGLVTLLV